MNSRFIDQIFSLLVRKKIFVVRIFQVLYFFLIILFIIGGRSILYVDQNFLWYYQLGVACGKVALVLYIITVIPGIARRFTIRNKILSLLTIFRRYIGILMYLFASIHFSFVRIIGLLSDTWSSWNFVLFELFGIIAVSLLFLLFITSNDLSLKRFNQWWYRIHKLTYIAMWFIFLHIAVQRISIWTILMGITLFLQVSSFVYSRLFVRTNELIRK